MTFAAFDNLTGWKRRLATNGLALAAGLLAALAHPPFGFLPGFLIAFTVVWLGQRRGGDEPPAAD